MSDTDETSDPDLEGPDAAPRTPARVLRILELLAADPHGQSLARLSEAMATPKSSLLSLLRSLHAAAMWSRSAAPTASIWRPTVWPAR